MTAFWEKLALTGVSVACASLAYLFADDPAVRGILMFLAGAPAGGAFIPRAAERELRAAAQHSRPY